MASGFLVTAFATLFVVIDPPGLVPLFIALTQGMDGAHRRRLALRACIIAFAILLAFGLLGDALLGFVGISLPAFRIAGGLLLFLTALDMLFERRTQRREGSKGLGEGMRRDLDQHQVGVGHGFVQGGGRAQAAGQGDGGQVTRVLALPYYRADGGRVAAPQDGPMAVASDQRGERGTP